MENLRADEHLVDLWFRLRDQMMKTMAAQPANAIRPPSLRDAAYAYVLASLADPDHRDSSRARERAVLPGRPNETSEETIESFVNGLELGAMQALRMAWNQHRTNQIANLPLKDRSADGD
jgi:hypothetical protein